MSTDLMTASPAKVYRSLRESWGFRPDWRSAAIEQQVAQLALVPDRNQAFREFCYAERDPFVRQGVRFRMTGHCASTAAFAWAYRTLDENVSTGLASIIRAMIVADGTIDEIAKELDSEPRSIATFVKLFFDLSSCLRNEIWLRGFAAPEVQEPATTIAEARERLMLRTAFESGWPGLRALLRGETEQGDDDLDTVARKIEALAAKRTLQFLRQLDASGFAPSEDDLKRFALIRSVRVREAVTNATDAEDRCAQFGRALCELVVGKMDETLPDERR